MTLNIRPALPSDQKVIGDIAYQTGFFGNSAARYFPSRELFSRLWVGPYFLGAGAGNFVAELDGTVLGYIVGSPDHRAYELALNAILYQVLPSLPRFQGWWGSLPYLLRVSRYPGPQANWQAYPAHLHMNLLPEARGHRIGQQLLQRHLQALRRMGVRGVQLSTTTQNQAALGLYHKLGFHQVISTVSPLWTPWLGHPATHVIMARRLGVSSEQNTRTHVDGQ